MLPQEPAPQQRDPDEDSETLWPMLLDYIERGRVIPVVGRDLLLVEALDDRGEAKQVSYYGLIAEELARTLKIAAEPGALSGPNPLGVVASEYIRRGGAPEQIYVRLPAVIARVDQRRSPRFPEALINLAKIPEFRAFVTTTFDPLLAECLHAVRQAPPTVLGYAPGAVNALADFKVGENRDRTIEILKGLSEPVVVHILGRLSNTPNYVVTEEDAFEFVYSLQETRKLYGLFDLLAQMQLLIIGCRFPTWLVRFFLRTVRRQRLLQSAFDRIDFVVDPDAAEDASLVQFLRNFRTQTKIFTGYRPTEFVDELRRRWEQRAEAERDPQQEWMTPCSIFISYASEDAMTAGRVAEQLREIGLRVWLDQSRLGAGNEWARKIRRNIENAAAFVPLLSASTAQAGGSREFRREWRFAYEVQQGIAQTESFIFPLVIDDLPRGTASVDEELRRLQWSRPDPEGKLPADFVSGLRNAYRSCQLREPRQ